MYKNALDVDYTPKRPHPQPDSLPLFWLTVMFCLAIVLMALCFPDSPNAADHSQGNLTPCTDTKETAL